MDQPALRLGQMWQGTYAPKYHVLALYADDAVWVLVYHTGVSARRQPAKPETLSRSFFEQPGMRCLYDPSPSRVVLAETLREHYLAEVVCDHERGQDNPICACSRVHLGWHPSVGHAVEAWVAHVVDSDAIPRTLLSPEEENNDG